MKEKYIINKPEDFASLPTKIQEEILSYWNDAYYNKDNPEVSDELYDTCMAIYNKKTDKTIEYLGEVSVDFKQYEHKYPVLSLGKINKKEDFLQYVKKFSPEEKTDEWDYPIIEPKIDGLTVVYYPDGKLSRRELYAIFFTGVGQSFSFVLLLQAEGTISNTIASITLAMTTFIVCNQARFNLIFFIYYFYFFKSIFYYCAMKSITTII